MSNKTIAIVATGDMGHAVGRVLIEHGHRAITSLAGRSDHSRVLAEKGGIEDLGSLEAVVAEADVFLSILPPAAAFGLSQEVAAAMSNAGARPVYVDCNAIAPETAVKVGATIKAAGASFIDAGIIGPRPSPGSQPRFYVSGDDTQPMEDLDGCGIKVVAMPGGGCQGSAIKMCYAGLTKGTWTLHTAVLLAAEQMGVRGLLMEEFAYSQSRALSQMESKVPSIPADSGRWIGEMEEIATSFKDAGVPDGFHLGAAEIFRILSRTPFAQETRENIDRERSLDDAVPVYAAHLDDNQD